MKKILFAIALFVAVAFSACNSGASDATTDTTDSIAADTTLVVDSIPADSAVVVDSVCVCE